MKNIISLVLLTFFHCTVFSQDTLPQFTLSSYSNKVTISWTNPYENLIQLNVQRSYDSLRYYTTIFSAPSPELPQNGFTDQNATSTNLYYRIFYVLKGGQYFFTKPQKAFIDMSAVNAATSNNSQRSSRDVNIPGLSRVISGDTRAMTVMIKDTVYRQFSINAFRNFRDSILRQTKDTLFAYNDSLVGLSPYIVKEYWKASAYVYANRDGYINISLPDIGERKYSIKFYEENGTPLFEIKNVKESPLILDKSSFIHSGWFAFELYEDNKLKEKNKFYLPKDF